MAWDYVSIHAKETEMLGDSEMSAFGMTTFQSFLCGRD